MLNQLDNWGIETEENPAAPEVIPARLLPRAPKLTRQNAGPRATALAAKITAGMNARQTANQSALDAWADNTAPQAPAPAPAPVAPVAAPAQGYITGPDGSTAHDVGGNLFLICRDFLPVKFAHRTTRGAPWRTVEITPASWADYRDMARPDFMARHFS